MPQNPAPPYYSDLCQQYGLTQALFFPTDPELIFALNPDDITSDDVDAGKSISIKYQSFIRDIPAVFTEFNIRLYGVSRSDLNIITNFANDDFLNNVRTTGLGSLALYYRGTELTGLYIQPPIISPVSVYKPWDPTPSETEVFDEVSFKVVSPDPRWF